MPRVRKIPNTQVSTDTETSPQVTISPAAIEHALARYHALPDRTGITRMRYAKVANGWQARVFARGVALGRLFSDSHYGGPDGALTAALTWRDTMRARIALLSS